MRGFVWIVTDEKGAVRGVYDEPQKAFRAVVANVSVAYDGRWDDGDGKGTIRYIDAGHAGDSVVRATITMCALNEWEV